MYTLLNEDSVPEVISAGNHKALYISILSIISVLTFLRGIYKNQFAYFALLFQLPCILTFSLIYDSVTNQTMLALASTGINETLAVSISQIQCPLATNCSCVSNCAYGYQCIDTPCLVNFLPIIGKTQCETEYIACYNQTTISTLSYNNIIYVYENSTYTFADEPIITKTTTSQVFLTWDPLKTIPQDYEPSGSIIVMILSLVFFLGMTLLFICFSFCDNEQSGDMTDTPSDAQSGAAITIRLDTSNDNTLQNSQQLPPPYCQYNKTPIFESSGL